MRRALVTLVALTASTLIVPQLPTQFSASAHAATPTVATPAVTAPAVARTPRSRAAVTYRDAALAHRPATSLTGTLTPLANDVPGAPVRYVVTTADGSTVPVSLDQLPTAVAAPRRFTGRVVLAAGRTTAEPLAVQSADLGTALGLSSTAATPAPSAHRLYVAVVTNRGPLAAMSTLTDQVDAMRAFWRTEAGGLITSFTRPSALVAYASSVAPSTADGCGLGGPSAVWNEARSHFPGVDFGAAGTHLMVLVPEACSGANGAGIGMVGAGLSSGGSTIVSVGSAGVQIGVHELGHNLSLEHANAEHCALVCTTSTYWNLYSVMGLAVSGGTWTPPALDSADRLHLGIAGPGEVPTVTTAGTVHLAGRGTAAGTRGFAVTDPETGAHYVVDFRSGTGRDATAFYPSDETINARRYRPGIVVARVEDDGSTTLMTRTSGSTDMTSYVAGETFARGALTLTVTVASPTAGADVAVRLDQPLAAFKPATPTLAGPVQVGARLVTHPGNWAPAPALVAYQWLADGSPIAGATAETFAPTPAQVGRRLAVRVTPWLAGLASVSTVSAPTPRVAAGTLRTAAPSVTGRATAGSVLTVHPGTWAPSPQFAFAWYASGRAIAHATGATLRLTPALRGSRITVRVVGSRSGYTSATRTSAPTDAVR